MKFFQKSSGKHAKFRMLTIVWCVMVAYLINYCCQFIATVTKQFAFNNSIW